MSSVSSATPSVQSGLDRLAIWLGAEGYGYQPIGQILGYVVAEGTLAGAPGLDPSDEEWAEAAYCLGLETSPEPQTSPAWDEHSHWTGKGPVYQTRGADLVLDLVSYRVRQYEAALEDALADTDEMPAPVCGGSPDDPDPTWPRIAWSCEERTAFERSIAAHFRLK